jgi:hypothetical protein
MEQTMSNCGFILLWCKHKGQRIAVNGGVGGGGGGGGGGGKKSS